MTVTIFVQNKILQLLKTLDKYSKSEMSWKINHWM